MNLWLVFSLLGASAAFMIAEMNGAPVVLQLPFKGDIKRESQFLAQFGQAVATLITAWLMYAFEQTPLGAKKALVTIGTVFGASIVCFVIKRLCGRVRPNRENAGKFLGPSLKHANWRESFPSSHSACAITLAVCLAILYPQAAVVFWTLGLITAILRYLMDAHWPSDVLAGIAIGYATAHLIMANCGLSAHAIAG
jgi:membrane-associated phospholipid phosphatase